MNHHLNRRVNPHQTIWPEIMYGCEFDERRACRVPHFKCYRV